jgi:environmental stress-induced protein Ves
MIDIVALDRVPSQPWRNGGGFTRELLAWPSADGWHVRISVAAITRDGAFSSFPGIERWFAVVEGQGVVLRFDDHRAVVGPEDDALRFDGATTPWAELQGGATRDLNLMSRRDAGTAEMQRVTHDDEWLSAAPLRAVFCTASARLQIDDADAAKLPAWSLAWSAHASRQRWRLLCDVEPMRAFWLSFEPRRS